MSPFTVIPDIVYGLSTVRIVPPAIMRWASLFSYHRIITLDKRQCRVTIATRWLWGLFRQERTIPFLEIMGVETDYEVIKDKNGRDAYQTYTILLRLKTRYERCPIARFRGYGEGVFFQQGPPQGKIR